jgi:hypothetical protein
MGTRSGVGIANGSMGVGDAVGRGICLGGTGIDGSGSFCKSPQGSALAEAFRRGSVAPLSRPLPELLRRPGGVPLRSCSGGSLWRRDRRLARAGSMGAASRLPVPPSP